MSRRGIVRATHGQHRWTFRLDQQRGSAFARLGSWRLTHVESPAPWLRELKAALVDTGGTGNAVDTDGDGEDIVAEWLMRALTRVGARLLGVRWQAANFPWPVWPEELRLGFPAAAALWPADFELLGLWLGTRRVAKRDALTPEAREARISWWRASGLAVEEVDGVVLGALDGETLAEAVAAQRALTNHEDTASAYLETPLATRVAASVRT